MSSQNKSQQKVLRSFRYAPLHATFTFDNVGVITYSHLKLLGNPSVTSGGYPPNHNILSFEAVGNPSTSHSNFIFNNPFVQAACSTSRRTMWHSASRLKNMIHATATTPEMPGTRAFSRQLVQASLPTSRPSFPVPSSHCSVLQVQRLSDFRRISGLHDLQDPRMVPALGIPSPVTVRRGRLPRPWRRPRRRGERCWGCDANASPSTGSV